MREPVECYVLSEQNGFLHGRCQLNRRKAVMDANNKWSKNMFGSVSRWCQMADLIWEILQVSTLYFYLILINILFVSYETEDHYVA